jgi:hypothetical protein
MALIITGTFIQFLCLAVQVIQLRLGRPREPGPRRPVPVGGRTAPDHGETARAALNSNARTRRRLTLWSRHPMQPHSPEAYGRARKTPRKPDDHWPKRGSSVGPRRPRATNLSVDSDTS